MKDNLTEQDLDKRDERVVEELMFVIKYKERLAKEMEQTVSELRKDIKRIRIAVKKEHWWELEGYLEQKDIESLCKVSPTNLLDE